ncbi:MAG: TRM11 family SAM-dependent methyltransferase [Opitutales bacterium]
MRSDNELYRRLRALPAGRLLSEEVPAFAALQGRERSARAALIRAVGTVVSACRDERLKSSALEWLRGLMKDPEEKVRRYAAAALPKFTAGVAEESALLDALKVSGEERERRKLASALEKVGGEFTLRAVESGATSGVSVRKVRAGLARRAGAAATKMDVPVPVGVGSRIHLRCRRGLESFVADECAGSPFNVREVRAGCVVAEAARAFTLAEAYRLRCFDFLAFPLGNIRDASAPSAVEELAALIASGHSVGLMEGLSEGAPRYRLSLPGASARLIERVAESAYARAPSVLNDPKSAGWTVDVIPCADGAEVELRPRVSPNPRMSYRTDAVDAASHPPLAACLARIAGDLRDAVIWDPFCGSGLELIERARLGGVARVTGTDIDPTAVGIARANFVSAALADVRGDFHACDFRKVKEATGLAPGGLSLVISNPPLGRRVRVPDMHGLFADLFSMSAEMLAPGGLLVFVNPLRREPEGLPLRLLHRRLVDLGGYDCRLEVYRREA